MGALINELVVKIKIASAAKVSHWKSSYIPRKSLRDTCSKSSNKVIAIGASTGGTEAISSILKVLPKDMPGIVIVQHMPPVFTKMYAQRLNGSCLLEIKEAQSGDIVCMGRVLIAPGDYHMRLKKSEGNYIVECRKGPRVSGHCPSVDVLFNSVAENAGRNAIGVILTGMGSDGAQGLLAMRKKGARTIGQDEKSSIIYGMPRVAYENGAVEKQASLGNIPHLIHSILKDRI